MASSATHDASFKFDEFDFDSNTLERVNHENQSFDPGGEKRHPKTPFNTNKQKGAKVDDGGEFDEIEHELRQELMQHEQQRPRAKQQLPARPAIVPDDLIYNPFDAINKPRQHAFEDIGQTLIIRDVLEDPLTRKTLLWSNPSPFSSGLQGRQKVVRHVEAPKPKGYSLAGPIQKFKPAGRYSFEQRLL